MVTPTISCINFTPNSSGSLIPRVKVNDDDDDNDLFHLAAMDGLTHTVYTYTGTTLKYKKKKI